MENNTEYFAFISYMREDEKWAVWLQHKLEHYKLPSNLNGRTDLPKEIRPIFRDQSELAGGVLAEELQKALERSRYLIVICSPNAAKSQWVGKEVESFIEMGRTDKIIPFIIDGTPHSHNQEDECFPSSLLNMPPEKELLGVNINEMGRDAAAVKVVAQMFGLKFDTLWQRFEREQKKRKKLVLGGVLAFAILAICVAGWIWQQNVRLKEKDWRMMENRSRFIAEKACSLVKDGDSYTAQRLLLEVLPESITDKSRPYTIEAEMALRNASFHQTAILHDDSYVHSAAYSPDGSLIATATNDRTIKIWSAKDCSLLKTLYGHNFAVWSVSFNPDGKRIVSASGDKTVRIWDIESNKELLELQGHTDCVWDASFSPDGKRVVSSSSDGTVRVWNAEDGTQLLRIMVPDYPIVRSANYSLDGKTIVTASFDGIVRLWSADDGVLLESFEIQDSHIYYANISPNCNQIISSTGDGLIQIWNVEDGSLHQSLEGHTDVVCSVAFSPNGKHAISASYDKTIKIWNLENGTLLQTLEGHSDYVLSAAFCSDEKHVVSSSYDKTVRIWSIDNISTNCFEGHTDIVHSAVFSPNNKQVASSSKDGTVIIWDEYSGVVHQTLEGNSNPRTVAYSSDGKRIVVASASFEGKVGIWDVDKGSWIHLLDEEGFRALAAAFSPDGKKVVSAEEKYIRVWDAEKGELLLSINGKNYGRISSVAFSPDGTRIVSASHNGCVCVWDAVNGSEVLMVAHRNPVWSAVFSPDGRYIATASSDGLVGIVSVWDAVDGSIFRRFEGHTSTVYSVSYSPDGRYVVSGSGDNTVRVWDVETNCLLQTFEGHSGAIHSVAFNQEGNLIASASNDSTVRIWSFPSFQDILYNAHERFKDNPLTSEERHQYYLEE